jgi:peptidoglycan lytic transglycosylase
VNRRWFWVLAACLVLDGLLLYFYWHQKRERQYDAVIVAASQRYRVAPALVKAVVWRESAFDGRARGRAGEIGLMQITEPAAMEWAQAAKLRDFRHAELYDPAKNTLAGSWYLRKLIGRYVNTDNPLAYALADYNAGRSNVLRWIKGAGATNSTAFIKQIDFPGTREYVKSVLSRYEHYKPMFRTQLAQN